MLYVLCQNILKGLSGYINLIHESHPWPCSYTTEKCENYEIARWNQLDYYGPEKVCGPEKRNYSEDGKIGFVIMVTKLKSLFCRNIYKDSLVNST